MTEQWKPVPGWEGQYEVSDLGAVRSLPRRAWSTRGSGFWVNVKGRHVKAPIRGGHPSVRLGGEEERQVRFLVLEAFTSPPYIGTPKHLDGDPTNNSLANLRWSDALDRLLDRATEDELGCWVHPSVNANGYATTGSGSQTVYAHRYVYERMRADIPDGLVIDHLCRNRACINPWHLEPVTQRTNVLRGALAGRNKPTSCKHGHPYTPENSYYTPQGIRSCRTCIRARQERAAS